MKNVTKMDIEKSSEKLTKGRLQLTKQKKVFETLSNVYNFSKCIGALAIVLA